MASEMAWPWPGKVAGLVIEGGGWGTRVRPKTWPNKTGLVRLRGLAASTPYRKSTQLAPAAFAEQNVVGIFPL